MKPSINFTTQDDLDNLPAGIKIDNAGPGPGVIKSFNYYLDRNSVGSSADSALKVIGLEKSENITYLDLEESDTLAVGESDWLIRYKKQPRGKLQKKEADHLMDLLDGRLAIQVEVCPVLGGDCVTKCSTKGRCEK
jgi:hypothetical protein